MTGELELTRRARHWAAGDVSVTGCRELAAIVDRVEGGDPAARTELAERMRGMPTFGTAGIRGPMRAGPNGMNNAVVTRTTAAVAAWLERHGHHGGTVVIGRDARYGSDEFARVAAHVFTAAGFDTRLLPRPLPTPVLAFAAHRMGAVAGVQITASHNPRGDNGYTLYDHTARQVCPSAAAEIESAVRATPVANEIPVRDGATVLGDEIVRAYLAEVSALPPGNARRLRVAATALHGVGADVLEQALTLAGFEAPYMVDSQRDPDPDFPTVDFPSPADPGATGALLRLAADVDADLAVALGPDADRCAIGVPTRDGGWRMLHGDETGVLLAEHTLATTHATDPLVATTMVSSSMLSAVAAEHRARYARTPPGFQWLTRSGEGLVYAYEEALGICAAPATVRDRDGISAALLACDLVATLRARSLIPQDSLDALAVRHGVHRTGRVVVRTEHPAELAAALTRLRTAPPGTLLSQPVVAEDLLPAIDALRLHGDGISVVIRRRGTEPELRAYLEVTEPAAGTALADARENADRELAALRAEVGNLLGH